jgi:hypothetical protein
MILMIKIGGEYVLEMLLIIDLKLVSSAFRKAEGHLYKAFFFFFFYSSGPRAYAPDASQPVGLLCYPNVFRRSHFRRQSVSSSVLPERPLAAKGGTAWARIMADNFD